MLAIPRTKVRLNFQKQGEHFVSKSEWVSEESLWKYFQFPVVVSGPYWIPLLLFWRTIFPIGPGRSIWRRQREKRTRSERKELFILHFACISEWSQAHKVFGPVFLHFFFFFWQFSFDIHAHKKGCVFSILPIATTKSTHFSTLQSLIPRCLPDESKWSFTLHFYYFPQLPQAGCLFFSPGGSDIWIHFSFPTL